MARRGDAAAEIEVEPAAGTTRLAGSLTVPAGAPGIVIFAHGSGSSRHSPRNRYVAAALAEAGLGTLLFDLLTPDEEVDRATNQGRTSRRWCPAAAALISRARDWQA